MSEWMQAISDWVHTATQQLDGIQTWTELTTEWMRLVESRLDQHMWWLIGLTVWNGFLTYIVLRGMSKPLDSDAEKR